MKAGHKRYLAFYTEASVSAFPTSENTLMLFTSHLAKGGLFHQSIKVYLSAVRKLHVTAGQHDAYSKALIPRLELLLKGIKKESSKYHPPHDRLPITLDIMQSIR